MTVTVILSLVLMAGLFLMLWSAVAFIQDKRFFTSAPKEVQAAVLPRREERFPGARRLGWKARYGDMDAFVRSLREEGYDDVRLIDTTDGTFMGHKEAAWLGLGGSTLLVGRK